MSATAARNDAAFKRPPDDSDVDQTTNQKQLDHAVVGTEEFIKAPWRALFFFTTRANTPLLILAIAISVIAGVLDPAKTYLMGKAFGGFTSYAAGNLTSDEFIHLEKKYVYYLLIVSGGAWLLSSLELTCWLAFGELQAKSARSRLFHGLLRKEIEWYDLRKNGIGALLPRIQAQIRELQLATSQPLGSFVNLTSIAILSLIQALVRAWDLTLVCLASTPVIMLAIALAGKNMSKNLEKQQAKLTEAQKFSTSALSAIETVKCFNGQEIERIKYITCVREAAQHYYRVANANALQMAFIVLLSVSMFVQGFYYGGVLIREGKKDASDVITTFFSAISAFQSITSIFPQMIVLEKGKVAGSTLRAIMAQVQQKPSAQRQSGAIIPITCMGRIELQNVSFAYPSRPQQLALDNITIQMPGGDLTFFIGTSGSGKSTLGQLLLQYYTSYQGRISLDGVDLRSLDEEWLRNNITLVEQTSTLFQDSIFNNIAFGARSGRKVYRQEVAEAAQFALMQQTINDMPNGWETLVGSKGSSLSGGQRQRMALARARLRDTPVLLLDESTSALDQVSRGLMMDAVRQWRQGRTTIIITHDISQIMQDDYAYVLEHGRVVQQGYRKHMEVIDDSPFQRFLPPDSRAATSPFGAQRANSNESIRTRGSSLDGPPDHRANALTSDLLETQLRVSENQRASFYPTVFSQGSPLLGMRGRAHALSVSPFSSPWMRLAAAPDSPSPQSPTFNRGSGLWNIKEPPSAPPSRPDPNNNQRVSVLLEKLVNRTGQFAAESRVHSSVHNRGQGTAAGARSSLSSAKGIADTDLEDNDHNPARTSQKSFIDIMKTLWPNLDWSARAMLILGFWGATIHAVSQPVFSYVLSRLLQTYAVPGGDKHKALIYSMIILVVAVVESLHVYLERYCLEYVSQRWVDNVRAEAMRRVLNQPREFFDLPENDASRITGSLDRNAEEMRNLLGRFCGMIWIAVLMVSISVVWALIANWKMTLISLSIAPYIYGVTKAFSMVSDKWEGLSNSAAEDAASIFTEVFTNIKTVRALTLEKHFVEKYIRTTKRVLRTGFLRSFYSGFFFGLSDSASFFCTALIFYVGAVLVKSGALVHNIVQVFTMLIFAVTSLGSILEFMPQIGASKDTASRLLRLAHLPDRSHEDQGDVSITTVGDLNLNGVQFAYPSRPEQTVLYNLSLQIPQGSCTAIVGGSGSGKSTIANLLLKLYTTTNKQQALYVRNTDEDLTLGGRNIKHVSTSSLRSLVVPVSQTPTMFSASIADNVSYGLLKRSEYSSMACIIDAAKQAGVHNFISSLPQGYDTPIGDGGMGLSGGQAQRIAIARALVRRPAVLILDEATSALDAESAALVRETVQDLVKERSRAMTVIVITHDRYMMEIAENIVVLSKGVLVEQSDFDDLINKNGALANLLSGGEWTNGDKPTTARRRLQQSSRDVERKKRERRKFTIQD